MALSGAAIGPAGWASVWTDDLPAEGIDVHDAISPDRVFGDTFES